MPHTREGVTSILMDHHTFIKGVDHAQGEGLARFSDAVEIDYNTTSTPPKVRETTKNGEYSHLSQEFKGIIVKSLQSGATVRQVARSAGVSVGTVSRVGRLSPEELERRTQSGGHRDKLQKTSPELSHALVDIVSEHQDYTLREMADALVERGFGRLSLKTIRGLLHLQANMQGASGSQFGERGGGAQSLGENFQPPEDRGGSLRLP